MPNQKEIKFVLLMICINVLVNEKKKREREKAANDAYNQMSYGEYWNKEI